MPVTHPYVSPVADDPAEAALNKVLPSHWNADHDVSVDLSTEVTGDLANTHLADMPSMTLKGNDTAGAFEPQDLSVAEVRTMLGIVDGVSSVTANDSSLTISPTTGAVLANINLGHTNTWTITQGITAASPELKLETTSTSSSTSTGTGAFTSYRNTGGAIAYVGCTTVNYSNPGTPFLANQGSFQTYGTGGLTIGSWGAGGDVTVFTANGGGSAREAFRVLSTGTTVFAAGSTVAGTAPIKLTSGALMTAPEPGAIEFLTDKYYGTINTDSDRCEFTLNDSALTAGRIPIVATNGRLVDDPKLTMDATNGRLMLGTAASTAGNDFFLQKTVNGQVAAIAQNLSTDAGAYSGVYAFNSANTCAVLKLSTTFSTSGLLAASDGLVYVDSGKLIVGNAGAGDTVLFAGGTATTNERLRCDSAGNVSVGNAAIATNATDGFLYIPTCAGAPSGTPTAKTGRVAMVFDTTNNKLMIYDGGWIGVTLS